MGEEFNFPKVRWTLLTAGIKNRPPYFTGFHPAGNELQKRAASPAFWWERLRELPCSEGAIAELAAWLSSTAGHGYWTSFPTKKKTLWSGLTQGAIVPQATPWERSTFWDALGTIHFIFPDLEIWKMFFFPDINHGSFFLPKKSTLLKKSTCFLFHLNQKPGKFKASIFPLNQASKQPSFVFLLMVMLPAPLLFFLFFFSPWSHTPFFLIPSSTQPGDLCGNTSQISKNAFCNLFSGCLD